MQKIIAYALLLTLVVYTGCKKDKNEMETNEASVDFLSNQKYDKLIIELQYVNGYMPSEETIDLIKLFLENRINKSNGVIITAQAINLSGLATYTISDIRNIEKNNRSIYTKSKTLTLYVLFVGGDYAANGSGSKTLGIQYGNSSVVIFEKTIRDYSGGLGQPDTYILESTVIEHEFGHVLGLVNNGSPMVTYHMGMSNDKHCNNKDCLMYFNVETTDVIANIIGNNVPVLDANCISDLQHNGGK